MIAHSYALILWSVAPVLFYFILFIKLNYTILISYNSMFPKQNHDWQECDEEINEFKK